MLPRPNLLLEILPRKTSVRGIRLIGEEVGDCVLPISFCVLPENRAGTEEPCYQSVKTKRKRYVYIWNCQGEKFLITGESYPQHSEGDTVESRAVCHCTAGSCLSALLSMLGHPNFEITRHIANQSFAKTSRCTRFEVPRINNKFV